MILEVSIDNEIYCVNNLYIFRKSVKYIFIHSEIKNCITAFSKSKTTLGIKITEELSSYIEDYRLALNKFEKFSALL